MLSLRFSWSSVSCKCYGESETSVTSSVFHCRWMNTEAISNLVQVCSCDSYEIPNKHFFLILLFHLQFPLKSISIENALLLVKILCKQQVHYHETPCMDYIHDWFNICYFQIGRNEFCEIPKARMRPEVLVNEKRIIMLPLWLHFACCSSKCFLGAREAD